MDKDRLSTRFERVVRVILIWSLLFSSIPTQTWRTLFSSHIGYAAHAAVHDLSLPDSIGKQITPAFLDTLPPKMVKELDQKTNGQFSEVLYDTGAMQQVKTSLNQLQFASDGYVNPISIERIQSTYMANEAISNTIVITFTVANLAPPALTPPASDATITETISATLAIDYSTDPNTVKNVLLTDSILPTNAVLISSSPQVDRDGESLAWDLGNIPPLSSTTVRLEVEVPRDISNFIELDSGAKAWGTLQGRIVSAATRSAVLAPQSFAEWLRWTVDANYYDPYMLRQAANLNNDPLRMFAFVRSFGHESYKGSLRGTRGTLWSEAGNSLQH